MYQDLSWGLVDMKSSNSFKSLVAFDTTYPVIPLKQFSPERAKYVEAEQKEEEGDDGEAETYSDHFKTRSHLLNIPTG